MVSCSISKQDKIKRTLGIFRYKTALYRSPIAACGYTASSARIEHYYFACQRRWRMAAQCAKYCDSSVSPLSRLLNRCMLCCLTISVGFFFVSYSVAYRTIITRFIYEYWFLIRVNQAPLDKIHAYVIYNNTRQTELQTIWLQEQSFRFVPVLKRHVSHNFGVSVSRFLCCMATVYQ